MTGTALAPNNAQLVEQIAELTRGLAFLDRTKSDHMFELGQKLIPIRQLLQATNGPRGPIGPDGLRPNGWHAWCKAARIAVPSAQAAIRRAVDPEGHLKQRSAENQARRSTKAAETILSLRRRWPGWPMAERVKLIAAVRELAQEANRAEA